MTARPETVEILTVDWADPRAVALRAAMDDEVMPRYADRFGEPDAEDAAVRAAAFAIDPDTMVVTLIATVDGVPAAHAALRDRQPEAVRLYEHLGYTAIPIYPPYEAIWFSQCYERMLAA